MGDALGGHLVQGHVDGVGTIRATERAGADVRLLIELPPALFGATLAEGVGHGRRRQPDGRRVRRAVVPVYLIPHTLAVTGLGGEAVRAIPSISKPTSSADT